MLILVVLFSLVAFGIFALSLRLGVRWAKIPGAGWGRVLAASVLIQAVSAALILLVHAARSWISLPEVAATAAELLVSVVATLLVLMAVLRTGLRHALMVWLATLAGSAIIVAMLVLLVNPYLVEAFTSPSNAMAPTLLGPHHVAACPRCRGPAYVSPDPFPRPGARPPELAICGRCLQVSEVADIPAAIDPPDRFLVDRLSAPRRWDVVVFRYPEDPSVQYAKRLVGLPGEAVSIKDGAVWIDGRRQRPPPPIERLVYVPEPGVDPARPPEDLPERSWTLGPDEYFVLGDFSLRSKDSRAWSRGAPGHPPFAVPRSHIAGVVTYIYWPPARWRQLR